MLVKLLNSPIINSWFCSIVTLFSSVFALPFVITTLSVEEINIWLLLSSIVVISQSVQFGFNGTFSRFISYVYAGVDISEFKDLRLKNELIYSVEYNKFDFIKVMNLMKFVYKVLAIIYFLLILVFGYFVLRKPLQNLNDPNEGWILGLIIAITTTLNLYFGYYQNFMIGINKVALVQRVTGIVNLLGIGLIFCVLIFLPSLNNIVIVYQLISVMVLYSVIYFSKKEYEILGLSKLNGFFDKKLFILVWQSAWKSGITTIISNFVRHMSVIFVSQMFSSSVSASFLFTRKLFNIIESFTMSSFNARLPVISKYRGVADFDKLIPFIRQTQYISYAVFLFSYLIILCFSNYFLLFINSNVNLGSYQLIILFSFSTLLTRWGGMTLSISNQSNHVVEHINALIVAFVYFVCIYIFYDDFGVNVFPFSLLIAMIFVAPFIINNTYKCIFTSFWKYEKYVFIPVLFIIVLINLIYYKCNLL